MAEIFLNYRHQDGHATGRLHYRLSDLGAFVDVDMQSGDSITREVKSALRDARVFLAVIGKEWMAPRNLKRLHRKNDWIRLELLEVLGWPEVRVVPLLVDDEHLRQGCRGYDRRELRELAHLALLSQRA